MGATAAVRAARDAHGAAAADMASEALGVWVEAACAQTDASLCEDAALADWETAVQNQATAQIASFLAAHWVTGVSFTTLDLLAALGQPCRTAQLVGRVDVALERLGLALVRGGRVVYLTDVFAGDALRLVKA